MLLVELHHLGVQLLRVFLELLAQLGDLGRELALLDHGLALGAELELLQRSEQQPDEAGQDDARDAVRPDRVEAGYPGYLRLEEGQRRLQSAPGGRPPRRPGDQDDVMS